LPLLSSIVPAADAHARDDDVAARERAVLTSSVAMTPRFGSLRASMT
jgi:hypothetical protein